MIEIKNLSKSYGKKLVLDKVTFRVEKGEVMGFLGANGAGKSTTMNIITGCLGGFSGSVKIGGHDILKDARKAKKLIGYLPEKPPLYKNMTAYEYLSFVYELKDLTCGKTKKEKEKNKREHIESIAEKCGIKDVLDRVIKNLSKGYGQRVGIAGALIGEPPIVILDEPTVGLDPIQIIEIRNLIKEIGKERTVIISSHILSEIAEVAEKVIIIEKGRIAAAAFTEKLLAEFSDVNSLILKADGKAEDIKKALSATYGVLDILVLSEEDGVAELLIKTEKDSRMGIMARLVEKDIKVRSFGIRELSLEEIFLKYVGGEDNEGDN